MDCLFGDDSDDYYEVRQDPKNAKFSVDDAPMVRDRRGGDRERLALHKVF